MMKKYGVFVAALIGLWSFTSVATADAQTKHPIVLIHGFLGFGEGMSWLVPYWNNIPELLRERGARVYVADVSQAHTVEARGEELRQQLIEWGQAPYNLIGHSHGGLDARYVLENYPELVASVTTINSPHRGSQVADYFFSHASPSEQDFFIRLGELLSYTIGFLSGSIHEADLLSATEGLTTEGLATFNRSHSIGLGDHYCTGGAPDHRGRKLYSWGSAIDENDGSLPSIFNFTSRMIEDVEGSDGLVAVCSMKFGKWLGALSGHHLAAVGGIIFPVTEEQKAQAKAMFLGHAVRLRKDGL